MKRRKTARLKFKMKYRTSRAPLWGLIQLLRDSGLIDELGYLTESGEIACGEISRRDSGPGMAGGGTLEHRPNSCVRASTKTLTLR